MKALKLAGYVAWFLGAFVVGVYLTFPLDEIRPLVIEVFEQQLGKGKQGPHGVDPKVDIGPMALSGFGLRAERIHIQLASRDPDPGPTIELDEAAVGVSPLSLLGDATTFRFNAEGYGGSADGKVSVDLAKGAVHDIDASIDDLDLSQIIMLQQKLGVPVSGKVSLEADVELGATPEKDGTGEIKLEAKDLNLSRGQLKLAAAFGGFELPDVNLGSLSAEIPVKQGKGTLSGVKLDGKDVQAELFGDITLRSKIQTSRLDFDGWFVLTPALLEREKKLQSALELGDSMLGLSKAKDDEGHYWFALKGPVQNPMPSLARDNGRRAKTKAAKGAGAPDAKEPKGRPAREPTEPKVEGEEPESKG